MPRSVDLASKMMVAGGVLTAALAFVTLSDASVVRTALVNKHNLSPSRVDTAVGVTMTLAVVLGLAAAVL